MPVTMKIVSEAYIHGLLRFEISLRKPPPFLSRTGR
jgi:hypothetical protein